MRIGSLFSGYGGLDMAVSAALGGDVAWHCQYDPTDKHQYAARILTHHWPDVPNHGDVTAVDWKSVEPVDVLTGGFPCQDLSHAGKRLGLRPGTRSGLWQHFAYAISELHPRLVIIENVRGLLNASAHSDLEPCPWCLGDGTDGALRALGAVLGDLASLGYDAEWVGLRASDAGAPHGRFRVFIAAHPQGDTGWFLNGDRAAAANSQDDGRQRSGATRGRRPGPADGDLLPTPTTRDWKGQNQRGDTSCLTGALMPTPRATDGTKGGPNQRGSSGDLMLPSAVTLLPTPAVNDMGEGKTPDAWDAWDAWTASMQEKHGNGNGHGKSLAIEAQRLLPTPSVSDGTGGHLNPSGERSGELLLPGVARDMGLRLLPTPKATNNEDRQSEGYGGRNGNFHDLVRSDRWGEYAEAIARWEHLTRPAPAPTQASSKGTPQLAPAFSEWMMGLPAGHVTDVPGLSRNAQLKALGNGVVPQQAALALAWLLSPALERAA